MIRKLFLLTIFLYLNACTTPYQRQTWYAYRGGYSEIKLSENNFKIVFNGNGHTPIEKVKDYALLRSAEVTTENNFKYFRIDNNEAKHVSRMTHSCYNGICTPITTSAPTASNVISCFIEKPKTKDLIYEAAAIIDELSQKYNLAQNKLK